MIKAEDIREYVSLSPDETKKIGYDLAKSCVGGETFLLSGELGAGKTVLPRALPKDSEFRIMSRVPPSPYTILIPGSSYLITLISTALKLPKKPPF